MKKRLLTDLEKIKIVELYSQGKSSTEIGILYNTSPGNILRYVKTRGGTIRDSSKCQIKYSVNDSYFETIDTPNKAYTLGLFYADGYNNQQRSRIVLNLQEEDVEILNKIKEDMKYTGPLLHDVKGILRKNQFRICITRKKLSDDLANLGCIQRKSAYLQFPNISKELYRHFIRGFYDGDGWITLDSRYNGKVATFGIIGLENVLIEIQSILHSNNIKCNILSYKEGKYTSKDIKYLQCTSRKELHKLFDYLYNDSELYLLRKFKKFEEFYNKTK